MIALTLTLLASLAAEPPENMNKWKKLDPLLMNANFGRLMPMNPFLNIPTGSSLTPAETHCMVTANSPPWPSNVKTFHVSGVPVTVGPYTNVDYHLAMQTATLNWSFGDASVGRTYDGADFLVEIGSTGGTHTFDSATGLTGTERLGNGQNDIVFLSATDFEAIGAAYTKPQDLTQSNAITAVWFPPSTSSFTIDGFTQSEISSQDCSSPAETDIFVRLTAPKAGSQTGKWVLGHSVAPDDEPSISLIETVMHEIGHSLTLLHPKVKPNTKRTVGSIMGPLHPFGGGFQDATDAFNEEEDIDDVGRILPADAQYIRHHYGLSNSISTVFVTAEQSWTRGGTQCLPDGFELDPEPDPPLPACPTNGFETVLTVDWSTQPTPTIEATFWAVPSPSAPPNDVSLTVWNLPLATSASSVEEIRSGAPQPSSAIWGWNACQGDRPSEFSWTGVPGDPTVPKFPERPRIVNLGPSDVNATVRYTLLPASYSGAAVELVNSTFTFEEGDIWAVGTNYRIPNALTPGWYQLTVSVVPNQPSNPDAPTDGSRHLFDDGLLSQTAFRVWDKTDATHCP